MFSRICFASYLVLGTILLLQTRNDLVRYVVMAGFIEIVYLAYFGLCCKFLSTLAGSTAAVAVVFCLRSKTMMGSSLWDLSWFSAYKARGTIRYKIQYSGWLKRLWGASHWVSLTLSKSSILAVLMTHPKQRCSENLRSNPLELVIARNDEMMLRAGTLEFQYSIEPVVIVSIVGTSCYFLVSDVIYETNVATGILTCYTIWLMMYCFGYVLYGPLFDRMMRLRCNLCKSMDGTEGLLRTEQHEHLHRKMNLEYDLKHLYFFVCVSLVFILHFVLPVPLLWTVDVCSTEQQEMLIFFLGILLDLLFIFAV